MVGEIDHSRKFPAVFRPSVAKVVYSKVEAFLKHLLDKQGTYLLVGCLLTRVPTSIDPDSFVPALWLCLVVTTGLKCYHVGSLLLLKVVVVLVG